MATKDPEGFKEGLEQRFCTSVKIRQIHINKELVRDACHRYIGLYTSDMSRIRGFHSPRYRYNIYKVTAHSYPGLLGEDSAYVSSRQLSPLRM
eukprot:7323184-Pyramimonas_sp.AAC.1